MTIENNKAIISNLQKSGILNPDLSVDELLEKTENLCEELGATISGVEDDGVPGIFMIKK